MISDQDLRDAARTCEKAILESILTPETEPASFSTGFEHSMKKLIFRVDHPVLDLLSRLLPILLLAIALAAANFLFNRINALSLSSSAAQSEPPSAGAVIYRPSWLPEGCILNRETLYDTEGIIVYKTAPFQTPYIYEEQILKYPEIAQKGHPL